MYNTVPKQEEVSVFIIILFHFCSDYTTPTVNFFIFSLIFNSTLFFLPIFSNSISQSCSFVLWNLIMFTFYSVTLIFSCYSSIKTSLVFMLYTMSKLGSELSSVLLHFFAYNFTVTLCHSKNVSSIKCN